MPPFVYSPHLSYWRSLDREMVVILARINLDFPPWKRLESPVERSDAMTGGAAIGSSISKREQ